MAKEGTNSYQPGMNHKRTPSIDPGLDAGARNIRLMSDRAIEAELASVEAIQQAT